MKILESQSAVLSNYEVLAHLTANRAKPRTVPQKHTNVETVLKELTDYLSPPPHSRSRIPPPYSAAALAALVAALSPYRLTKSEVLMIANLRPDNLGLLDCVVEECDERFSIESQEKIVRVVGDVLGR
ncbi:RNA polymerase II, partial [Usnea florida]